MMTGPKARSGSWRQRHRSTIAGLLYTIASPAVAFGYVAACMALALAALAWAAKPAPFVSEQSDR